MIWGYDASWRGVPFGTSGTSTAGGRKTSSHDYAQVDGQWVEDRARRARAYHIQAFVRGDAARQKLIDACETPGPGVLVHPTLGRMVAQLIEYTSADGVEDGDLVRFDLALAETKAPPLAVFGGLRSGALAIATTLDAATAEAGATLALADPATLSGITASVTAQANAARAAVLGPLATATATRLAVDAASASAISAVANLSTAPATAVAAIADMVASVADSQAIRALQRWAADLSDPPMSSTGEAPADSARRAVNHLWRRTIACQLGTALAEAEYAAQDDAEAARLEWVTACDGLLLAGGLVLEIQAMLGAIAAVLDALAARLPDLVTVRLPAPMPALVLAHTLYGDRSRDGEIVERNRFPGGLLSGSVVALAR